MRDLFLTITGGAAYSVLLLAIGMAVGRDRERALHETRVMPTERDYIDHLLVDGGSLAAARHERIRRVK